MARRAVDENLLMAIAATGPAAEAMIRDMLAGRRGRPSKHEAAYRRLHLWWSAFRRLNSGVTEEQALRKFLRVRGDVVKKELGLSRKTAESLRKAIARGNRETARVRAKRHLNWRLIPTGLAQAIHGRARMLVKDPNEAALLRAALTRLLLKDGPPVGLANIDRFSAE